MRDVNRQIWFQCGIRVLTVFVNTFIVIFEFYCTLCPFLLSELQSTRTQKMQIIIIRCHTKIKVTKNRSMRLSTRYLLSKLPPLFMLVFKCHLLTLRQTGWNRPINLTYIFWISRGILKISLLYRCSYKTKLCRYFHCIIISSWF